MDDVHSHIGKSVATSFRDEKNQEKIVNEFGNIAKNKEYHKHISTTIANNSDNEIVKHLAKNEQVQEFVGDSVSSVVSNKEVQRAVGNALASAAEDKETQKKVAGAVWEGTKRSSSLLGNVASSAAK